MTISGVCLTLIALLTLRARSVSLAPSPPAVRLARAADACERVGYQFEVY